MVVKLVLIRPETTEVIITVNEAWDADAKRGASLASDRSPFL